MAKNRYLPYGYKIENGKTIIELREAEIIRRIYRAYAEGLSYKKIAEQLTAESVCYLPEKSVWNKNRVARILQNTHYNGSEKYPAILEASQRQAAQTMQKPYTHTESPDIKTLKPLLVCGVCGEHLRRRLKTSGEERWFCPSDVKHIGTTLTDETLLESIQSLQNHLAENPELAAAPPKEDSRIDLAVIRLQNEIDHALSRPEPDLPQLRQSILALASQKYAFTEDAEDDGVLSLPRLNPSGLNAQWLKSITEQITVTYIRATALVLKNGQIIQPPAAEKGAQSHE
jgi:hypothetical protein